MKEELFNHPESAQADVSATLRARGAVLLAAPPRQEGMALLQELHRRLFTGLDARAGQLRQADLPLAGENTPICYTGFLQEEQQRLFAELAQKDSLRGLPPGELALELAYLDAQLWALHPFLAGNGPAIDCFLAILAAQAGLPLDADACPQAELEAARQAILQGALAPLCACYKKMLRMH